MEEETELIKREEMLIYERKVRKDREKEKKKYIAPMPINNVNIKLDEKFTHKLKEVPCLPETLMN